MNSSPPADNLRSDSETARRSRAIEASPVYYGWVILAAATLGVIMTMPGQTVGVSAFLDAIIRDLGLSRSTVSLMYSLGTLAGACAMPFVGRWIDRRGPRLGVTVVAALFALACFGMSRVNGPAALLLGFVAIRGLGQGALGLVSLHVVNLWFVRRRGLAIGLKGVGMAAASACFPIAIQGLIAAHGWRSAYAHLGLLVALTILPAGAALFRERPERFGLLPDGPGGASGGERVPEEAWTLAEARRTAIFWLLIAGSLLPSALGTGLVFHHFSIMEHNGLDRMAAAAVFVPIAGVAAATNLLSGLLLDRIQPRALLSVALGLLAAALLAATRVATPQAAWLYGALLGMMQGMQGAIAGTAWAHYFGRANHGAIKGFAFTVMVGGSAFGPLPFAWGLEAFGRYGPVLGISAVLPVAVALAGLFVRNPRRLPRPA
jgi:MFS transporter, OFA family, oxalate/formate antiporter